jgi:hypothetical protein
LPTTVPANIDATAWTDSGGLIPASSANEPTGNFRFICEASHLAYDDPIVKPGQRGTSHLHMFFGNTTADGNSDYSTLRNNGNSSCQGGPLNRSAYWVPAVLNNNGSVIMPDHIAVYYKGNGPSAAEIANIRTMPAGLKMLAGYDQNNPSASRYFHWMCENGSGQGGVIPSCPNGTRVGAVIEFPSCWDGLNLDSPNHRSHMAYLERDRHTGKVRCPATHRVMLPQFTAGVWYTHRGDSATWKLSSDMSPGTAGGSTFHADWFGAWDPVVEATWTRECVNKLRNCIAGQLGDGRTLAGPWTRYTGAKLLPAP